MLNEQEKPPRLLHKFFDTFFHLPTLLAMAVVSLVLIWQLYDIGFNISNEFVRVNSNRGNVTFYWGNGCCQLR